MTWSTDHTLNLERQRLSERRRASEGDTTRGRIKDRVSSAKRRFSSLFFWRLDTWCTRRSIVAVLCFTEGDGGVENVTSPNASREVWRSKNCGPLPLCPGGSTVERLFCKQGVAGSIPVGGSSPSRTRLGSGAGVCVSVRGSQCAAERH